MSLRRRAIDGRSSATLLAIPHPTDAEASGRQDATWESDTPREGSMADEPDPPAALGRTAGGEPLYRQVAAALRAEIEARLQPGQTIATESELERRFGVSRITVRKAIELLAQEGLLVRRQGSGTFVARRLVTEELGVLLGWTDSMRMQGLEPQTVDCEMLRVMPPAWVSLALRLDPEAPEPVLRIQRLRYADGEPLCLMTDYLRPHLVPGLEAEGLLGESLYETLERRYGLTLARVEDTVGARAATIMESRLLGLTAGSPVLTVARITHLPDDEPIDAAAVVARADRYAYRVAGRPHRPRAGIERGQ